MKKGPKRIVQLYKGRDPTSMEIGSKNRRLNPVIAIDETGSVGPLASNDGSKRESFIIVGT